MTSICVITEENGSVSACPVIDLDQNKEGDIYALLVLANPNKGLIMNLRLSPEGAEKLGEALVQIGKELLGRA